MDNMQAVTTVLYTELTTNAALLAIFGHLPHVHYVFATEEEPPFPYIVHRLDLLEPPAGVVMSVGEWYCDIWDYSDIADRTLEIRKAIVELFDKRILSAPGATKILLHLGACSFVPDTEHRIWHYTMRFAIRYTRTQEVISIVARD